MSGTQKETLDYASPKSWKALNNVPSLNSSCPNFKYRMSMALPLPVGRERGAGGDSRGWLGARPAFPLPAPFGNSRVVGGKFRPF